MRLNDVLTIIGLSLLITVINIPNTYSILSSECPGRDVPTIRQLADQTELSFILYYVSWCHESRVAKEVYDEVAQQYYDQANFAAVNCWHLECNCSYTFPSALGSKKGYPHKWPTLLVRYGRRLLVQYHDEWKFTALSRFLENLYQPVERLNTKEELKMMTMRSNAIVLGLFPNASIVDYRKFTFAAVKWLENDPEQLVRFSVAVGLVAEDIVRSLGATMPLIVLLSDKEIEVFNSSSIWTANHIVLWLKTEVKRLRKHFYGFSNPLLLAEHVRRGAVLGIFVNELENPNNNFYDYMTSVIKNFGFVPPQKPSIQQCDVFLDDSEHSQAKRTYAMQLKKEFDDINIKKFSCQAKPLMNTAYTPYNELRIYYAKAYLMQFQPSAQQQAEDPYSSVNLLQLYKYNECLRMPSSEGTPELQTIIAKLFSKFIRKIANDSKANRRNRTMSVHIMDANKYQGLLHDLGLSDFEKTPHTTAFIIEPNQEGIYVMQKPILYEKLVNFIKDYYNENLELKRRSSFNLAIQPLSPLNIGDLNRNKFLNSIQHHWRNTTTVLLLYSPRCAISWLMSFTLMQVSTMLQNSRQHHNINIVRINTYSNDLPWEFVMNEVPALLVFPCGRPEESRLFPSEMKINVRNIFGFILAQLEPLEQVHVALGSCALPAEKLLKCLNFVKTLAMQQIQEHLRLWQLFEKDRETILKRLKIFKDITLNIQASFPL